MCSIGSFWHLWTEEELRILFLKLVFAVIRRTTCWSVWPNYIASRRPWQWSKLLLQEFDTVVECSKGELRLQNSPRVRFLLNKVLTREIGNMVLWSCGPPCINSRHLIGGAPDIVYIIYWVMPSRSRTLVWPTSSTLLTLFTITFSIVQSCSEKISVQQVWLIKYCPRNV